MTYCTWFCRTKVPCWTCCVKEALVRLIRPFLRTVFNWLTPFSFKLCVTCSHEIPSRTIERGKKKKQCWEVCRQRKQMDIEVFAKSNASVRDWWRQDGESARPDICFFLRQRRNYWKNSGDCPAVTGMRQKWICEVTRPVRSHRLG